MKPRIFISSVSSELATARQDVANVLTRLGYEPVWQDVFGTDAGQLKAVLQSKIDDCEGLIQLVGRGYGAEPVDADAEFGRVSYTQYEFLYAQKTGKKTWIVFAEEGCTRDKPINELDLPRDPAHADPAAYQAERRALQDAWRARLKGDGQLRHAAANDPELKLKINELNEEFARLRHRFRRWQKLVLGSSVAILVLLGIVIAVQIWQKRDAEFTKKATDQKLEEIKANQEVTAARIKVQLEEASKKALKQELAKADQEPRFDEREKLKDAARKSHEMQMERIGDLSSRFAELETHADISEDFKEMVRILSTEKVNAVEKAVVFAEKGRVSRFDRVRQRRAAEQEQNRMELQTDLKAAALAESSRETVKARALYDEILKLEPDWPEALVAAAWFLQNQSRNTFRHAVLHDSLADSERSVELAEHLATLDRHNPASERVLAATYDLRGDILLVRGQPGDMEQALKHYTGSLVERERILTRNPESAEAAREVSASLGRLGTFLWRRGQPGDAEQALRHYTRSLELDEELLKRNPESALAARDMFTGLQQLGDFLAQRGQPGDMEQALKHCTRSLELAETLLKQNPDSVQAAHDVSHGLNQLGGFLAQRGLGSDRDQALQHFMRSVELTETLLKRNPESAQAARDVLFSLHRVGDFLARLGQPRDLEQAQNDFERDLEQAQNYFVRELELAEKLLLRNPESAQAARDVWAVLGPLGDILIQRRQPGDMESVLKHYSRSVDLAEALLMRNPDSAVATRDVSFSLCRLGDFLAQRGQGDDLEQAHQHYTRSLELVETLLTRNPESAQAALDVSNALIRLCNFLTRRGQAGDQERVLNLYSRDVALAEAMLKQHPDSMEAACTMSLGLLRLGDALMQRRQPEDMAGTVKHYSRSVALSEAMLTRNPESLKALRVAFVAINRLGSVLVQRGQAGDAEQGLKHYARGLELAEELLKRNPDSAEAAADVIMAQNCVGEMEWRMDHFETALKHYQNGLVVLDQVLAQGMNVEQSKLDRANFEKRVLDCREAIISLGEWDTLLKGDAALLSTRLSLRVTHLARHERIGDVAQAGAKLRELAANSAKGAAIDQQGGMLYNAARAYGLCAGLVVKAGSEQTEAQAAEKRKFIDLSLACLKEAIAGGYENFNHLRQDSDLAALHGLPEFEALFPTSQRDGK